MRREFASVLMLLLLVGSVGPAIAIGGNPAKPLGGDDKKGRAKAEEDFLLDLTPSSRIVPLGRLSIVKYAISVKAMGHFRERVELSLKGVPPGATGIIDKSYGVPPFATTLTVIVTPSVAGGVYTLTVIGKSGDIAHSAEAALVVGRGGNATSTVTTATTTTAVTTTATGAPTGVLMVSVGTDKQSYAQGEAVEIRGFVKDSFGNLVEGVRISIQVDGPSGGAVQTDLASTDSIGSFRSGFTLPKDAQSGTYTVYVTASKEGYMDGRGQASFSVGESQTPAVTIAALYLSDMGNATKSTFSPGETLIVWVVVRNAGAPLERGTIWAEVDDPGSVPLMVQFQIAAIGRGAEVRAGFSLTLSAEAYPGAYRVKAFVSDKMISEGGKFLASQVASFAVAPPEAVTTSETTSATGTTTTTSSTTSTTTGTIETVTTTTTTTTTTSTTSGEATTTSTSTTTSEAATQSG
ncbi:MAG: MG2 domain-containing protein [Candidatus Bathyarchaeia archaeon]